MRIRMLLVLAFMLLTPVGVMAQTPEAEEDSITMALLEEAGISAIAGAEIAYEMAGISFTEPLMFGFMAGSFGTEDDASTAFEIFRDTFADAWLEDLLGNEETSDPVINEVSPPVVGDERYALMLTAEFDGIELSVGMVFFRRDNVVAIGFTGGLLGNMVGSIEPMVLLIDERIQDTHPETDDELFATLPELADMPPGYIVSVDD